MRANLCKVLLCLILVASAVQAKAYDNNSISVFIDPNYSDQTAPASGEQYFRPAVAHERDFPVKAGFFGPPKPIVKCKGPVCALPAPMCAPLPPPCILPKRMPGQWEVSAKLFYARIGGTVSWPATVNGLPASELDLNDDLGVSKHEYIAEYTARYQLRCNWSIYYSVMPYEMDDSTFTNRQLNFAIWNIPAGSYIKTHWQNFYQKVGLEYQAINTCALQVSVSGGWLFHDQSVRADCDICGGRGVPVDRTRNMAYSGIEVRKCIKTMCNGATLSCFNRIDLAWLDDTFGYDLQTSLQFSVPMNCGRWGYARSGYRWIDFREDRDDLRLDTHLDGWFIEAGLIF